MAKKSIQHNFDVYTICAADGKTRASFVPEKGGVGSSLIMPDQHGERELLFLHDFFWQRELPDLPGGWPFLFPICARIERNGKEGNYLYDGHVYNLPIHGVSWWNTWQVLDNEHADQITLALFDNETTLAHYPFAFEVRLTYRVSPGKLTCEQTYINCGDKPMPYYAGFHPYFLTPAFGAGKEKVLLNLEPSKRFVYNNRLTDLIGERELPVLPTPITNPDINEQLMQLGHNKTTQLIYPDGFVIRMTAEGQEDPNLFSYLQCYTISNKPFFCVEPWMAFPNALNTVSGVRWLAAGASERGLLTLHSTV
ncbi:MAG: aldose epimerase [Gammaproteobacteria bacterium]